MCARVKAWGKGGWWVQRPGHVRGFSKNRGHAPALSCNQLCRKTKQSLLYFGACKAPPSLVVLLLLARQEQAGAQLCPAGRGQGLVLSRGLLQANSPAVCYGKDAGTVQGKMGQRGWNRGREATEGAGMLGID